MTIIEFEHRGLMVTAEISDYVKGDRVDPPEGGEVESVSWEVDNFEVLTAELDLDHQAERDVHLGYLFTGKLPLSVKGIINGWDLMGAAEEYFTDTVGGPSGLEDHCG